MKSQFARIVVAANAGLGTTVTVGSSRGGEPVPLPVGHDHVLNLKPGDKITIEVGNDERWLEKQRAKDGGLTDLDQAAREDIAANPQAGPDLSGEPGMTLDQGLKVADGDQPVVAADAGEVTADTGATRTRTTRAPR